MSNEGEIYMPTYCIIPDNYNQFFAFVDDLPISNSDKQLLKQCTVSKINVDSTNSTWEIFLNSSRMLAIQLLTIAAEHLSRNCGIRNVHFVPKIQDFTQYLTDNWQDFVTQIAGAHQGVKHLLKNAVWHIDGETLSIEVVGDLSGQILTNKHVDQAIYHFIYKQYGLNYIIQFVTVAPSADDNDLSAALPQQQFEPTTTSAPKTVKNQALFGRAIKGQAQPISTIQEECRNVIISGQLSNVEMRELRSGRFLLTFDVADAADGISGKAFFDNREQGQKAAGLVKNSLWVTVKGTVQFDKYSSELVMFADAMCQAASPPERMDHSATPRVELHAHTRMSTLDSVVATKNLIKTAAKWGHPAVAITDHGVVQAFPEAHIEAEKAGIKVIYGMEGYLFDNDINQARHIVILAKDTVGLRNLYRLVSISHLKYLHRTPRIPRSVLSELREGLIFGSACEAGELIQAILRGASDDELLQIAAFYDYLEIQPIGNNGFLLREGKVADEQGLRDVNCKVCELGTKLNKPVVATCDVHFLNPSDEVYRRILMAGRGYSDADIQPPLYFRTTEEMLAEFSYLGEKKAREIVIDNPRHIAESIAQFKPIPDELYSPQIPGAEEQIKSMSYQRARELYGDPLPEIVAQRLDSELNSIINHGFAVLYLIAHKLVKKSLDDGYLVGSRGSVGSSFVATMTDITEVNPLPPHWRCPNCQHVEFVTDGSYGGGFDLPDKLCPKCQSKTVKDGHNIPFAVFMGFHGDKVPDIDLNFSGDYQPVAHKYTEELFGRDNVFRAGTIATIADKTAYGYVKNYTAEKGVTCRNAQINKLVAGCTGVKRTTGQHPGGIMVVPRDMDVHYFTPIQYPADDKNSATITTHFDYHSISSRLVKLDILGHDDPTVIKMLEDITGLNPKTIPFDDAKTMSLFSSTEALGLNPEELGSTVGTFGIPEYGTKFVRQMLEDTKPQTFSELVRISGFSHGTDVWLNNAQDLIKNGTATLSEAISARDDIMVSLMLKGVEPLLSFKIMESVRKGKGLKPEDIAKMREKDVPEWFIESCKKIKYLFPRAHAVAYVMMAFRIAYCKVYYPLAFYASYFSVRADDFDADLITGGLNVVRSKLHELEQKGNTATAKEKSLQTILEVAMEMYLRGFEFSKVNLYRSDATKFLLTDNGLLPPLAALQGLGNSAAYNIVAAREQRPFSSLEDLRLRARISKTVVDILRNHGCLDNIPETDQITLFA